jgi:ATP-dependent DNA ligase
MPNHLHSVFKMTAVLGRGRGGRAPARRPAGFIEPCLPTVGDAVPIGPNWVYEIKHDGFRFICRRDGDHVRVFSRRGHDWTDRVPRIVDALRALPVTSVTLDGEGVVCRPDGVSDFDQLRAAVSRRSSREAFLYAFDVLELDGQDLRREPWERRRATLRAIADRARHSIVGAHRRWRRRSDVQARLRHGARRHRRQATRPALCFGAVARLDQGEEPGRAGRDETDRGMNSRWPLDASTCCP